MKSIFGCAISLGIVLLLVLGSVEWSPVGASTPTPESPAMTKEFFRGKDITLIPMTPSGSYDATARIIAPKLKEILGARVVLVQYRGEFVPTTNYVYNRAKPDGLTMLHFSLGSRGFSQLMRTPGIEYDVREFVPVGQFVPPPGGILLTKGSLGLKTIADIKKLKQFRVATTARYSDHQLTSTLLFEYFDISNAKFMVGYPGLTEALLAVQRGEAEASAAVTTASALWDKKSIDSGLYNVTVVYTKKRVEPFPDSPTVFEMGQWRPEFKRWLEVLMTVSDLYNTWVLPPGTPLERVAYLREAFANLWADNEIKKQLSNLFKGYVDFRPGSETEQLIKREFPQVRTFTEAEVQWLRQLMDKWAQK